jgi:Sigma-54 interaction domain
MENPAKVFAGGARAAEPNDGATRRPDDLRLAWTARDALLRMGMPRVNVLLMGSLTVIEAVLQTLVKNLHTPVASWFPGQPLVLPPADRPGTFVLHEVGTLGLQDQIRLLEWLGLSMGRTQVVSTSSAPLLPMVEGGSFIDTLYYRLNLVYVDVTEAGH